MTIPTLLTPAYWFNADVPRVDSPYGIALFAVMVLLFGASIGLRLMARRHKDNRALLYRAIGRLCLTMSILGGVLLFLSYENIRVLGARFWYPLWAIVTLVWAMVLVRYARQTLPAMSAEAQARATVDPYLPRPKKR